MHKFPLTNRRVFLTQDFKNNYPLESRARSHPHSVAEQIFNPVALEVSKSFLEVDRYFNNYIPTLMDHEEIDVVYRCPNIISHREDEDWLIEGETIGSTDRVVIQSSLSALSDFWYSKLPTRLVPTGTYSRTIYPTKQSLPQYGERYLSFEYYNQYFDAYTEDLVNAEDISTNTRRVELKGTDDTSFSYKKTAVLDNTNGFLLFSLYENLHNEEIERVEYRFGIEGVSTNYSTDTNLEYNYFKQKTFYFDGNDSTGSPFFEAEYFSNSYLDLDVSISNIYSKDLYGDFADSTSKTHLPPSLHQQLPQRAFVKLENGAGLVSPNSKIPTAVSGVIIKGINRRGQLDEEFLYMTHNGVHEGFKHWYFIKEAIPFYLNSEATIQVQQQDYGSTDYYFDPTQRFTDEYGDNFLFRRIGTREEGSFLEFASYNSPNPDIVEDYTPKVRTEIELRSEVDNSIQVLDYTFDFQNQLIWVLAENRLYLYDLLDHEPSQEAFKEYLGRTTDSGIAIEVLEDMKLSTVIDGTKSFQARWFNRNYYLRRYRWALKKPNGDLVNIRTDGSEVPVSPAEWIDNDGLFSERTQEWVFEPLPIEVSFDQYGDYVLYLEAEFYDEDTNRTLFHRDVQIVSIFKKLPLKVFELEGDPFGITSSYDGDLLLAYETDIPFLVSEIKLRPKYDYYFVSENNRELIFREHYQNIYFTYEEEEDGEVCKKTILLKTTSDALTTAQIDCYFVVVNSGSGAITFPLPSITSTLNGSTIVVKRIGANNVQINASGGDSIDGDPNLVLYSDYDAITLTAIYSLNMWAIS